MRRVAIAISPQAADALDAMLETGLYGKTVEDVARTLLYERLRAYAVLPKRRRGKR